MPNIKKLRAYYRPNYQGGNLQNVGSLNKLESLKCSSYYPSKHNLLGEISFPSSLKKFTLDNCRLEWNQLTMIGSLPHIEVLKLCNVVAKGTEWNPVQGEFPRLQFLGIYGCPYLICWNADDSHFPMLKKLVHERVWKLDEIPLEIGQTPTLEHIFVYDCSISASAVKIREEQESLENHDLQVKGHFSTSYEQLEFSRRLKELEL